MTESGGAPAIAGVRGETTPRPHVTAAVRRRVWAWPRLTPTALRAAPPDPRPSRWLDLCEPGVLCVERRETAGDTWRSACSAPQRSLRFVRLRVLGEPAVRDPLL